ncbi:hypothetical protein HK102_002704, partial [Quaeritorhiza haematococci]
MLASFLSLLLVLSTVNAQVCGPQAGGASCPLNVCCSFAGYCGLGTEFCATGGSQACVSNCNAPSVPSNCNGEKLTRKAGYYAGWGAERSCFPVPPEDLNLEGFTHVFFSFAVVSPSFQIQLTNNDEDILKRLVAARNAKYPSLHINIAVGGWSFSQDAPTRDIFPTMMSTPSNRQTFINSVKDFLAKYGLNGIDIDHEYPAAEERGGTPSETPNFTALMKELRAGLAGEFDLSLATPGGYYTLKGIEIGKVAQEVTFINMMNYDYHGTWERTADAHTSMVDIRTSLELYIRAGVPPEKLNLGLALYGRTAKLASSGCAKYGCGITAPGQGGSCTKSSGEITYFEIQQLISQSNIKPTFDDKTGSKYFSHQGDLVNYDDPDTWAIKVDYAKKSCLGGVMMWSIDQVLPGTAFPGPGSSSGGGNVPVPPPSNPTTTVAATTTTTRRSSPTTTTTTTTVPSRPTEPPRSEAPTTTTTTNAAQSPPVVEPTEGNPEQASPTKQARS